MSLSSEEYHRLKVGDGVSIEWWVPRTLNSLPDDWAPREYERGVIVRKYFKFDPEHKTVTQIAGGRRKTLFDKVLMLSVCDLDSEKHSAVPFEKVKKLSTFSLTINELLTCKNTEVREFAAAINALVGEENVSESR